jgi:DNA-binding transcriptional LysR family regulator
MDTLRSIAVFRQVVESGSFASAAERLEMSTAAVSKHVNSVERRLGVRLLNRNNRNLSLTEPGSVYFEQCKSLLDNLQATELELGSLSAAPRGTLRITCPSWYAGQRLTSLLTEYHRCCPEVVIDASCEDRFADLVEEGYDLALRITSSPQSLPAALIGRPVRSETFQLAASREYLRRRRAPISAEELVNHDFVAAGSASSVTLVGEDGPCEIPVHIVLRCRSMCGVVNAVAAGIGIARIPTAYFEDPQFEGSLTPVLPQQHLSDATLYVLYASRAFLPLKIRTFVDFVIECLSGRPDTVPTPTYNDAPTARVQRGASGNADARGG